MRHPSPTNFRPSKKLLSEAAVLKLNGGLGTSMGLEKAKSLLEVKDGKTFLDLIAEQVKHLRTTFNSNVKFILMNSFSTSEDTKAYLSKEHADLVAEPYFELFQNKSPKVDAKTMEPALFPSDPSMEWCVPSSPSQKPPWHHAPPLQASLPSWPPIYPSMESCAPLRP
jgi:UDP-N-acetylglucosamine pyrophosphorylase